MNFGEDYGKMVVIVDMLDINRVLTDTPDGSMPRLVYPIKRLTLTKIKVKGVLRGCRTSTLKKLSVKQDIVSGFKKTSAATKIARSVVRSKLTDFEKFKVMVLRKQRSWRKTHLNEKSKAPAAKKAPPKKEAPPAKKDVPSSPGGGKKGKKGAEAAKPADVPPSPSGGKKGKKGKKGQAE